MDNVTINFLLDTRKEKKNFRYPIKFTVYFLNDKKRYGTGLDATEDEWLKMHSPKLRDAGLKEIKLKLDTITKKANKIIKGLDEFSFHEFEEAYFCTNAQLSNNSLYALFEKYIKELKSEGRIGTAASYNTTLNSLTAIKKGMRINEVTTPFLKHYEQSHRDKNNSDATIGINMRNIRTIINKAIALKMLSYEKYPFRGYCIPTGQNVKKALDWDDLQKLINYEPVNPYAAKALDYWRFSYLCHGMNMKDIALLEKDWIDADFLVFRRAKTIRTRKKNQRPIKVALHDRAKAIIEKYQRDDNPFVFGILEPGLDPVTQRNRIQRVIKFANDHLKAIAIKLEIKAGMADNLTTYSARHSFATTLKRKGISTDEISEYLGHASIATTKSYLDSFTDDLLKARSKLLVD